MVTKEQKELLRLYEEATDARKKLIQARENWDKLVAAEAKARAALRTFLGNGEGEPDPARIPSLTDTLMLAIKEQLGDFTAHDVQGTMSKLTTNTLLHRLRERGLIIRVRHGVYRKKP